MAENDTEIQAENNKKYRQRATQGREMKQRKLHT
jgi:hypothetical protein